MNKIFVFLCLFISLNAHEVFGHNGIKGLFSHEPGKDEITVFLKENRPMIKIWDSDYPNIQACDSGYQTYRSQQYDASKPIEIPKDKIIALPLFINGACIAAQTLMKGKIPKRTLIQNIDIYNELSFKNKNEVIREFEQGNLGLGVFVQARIDDYNYRTFKISFYFKEAFDEKKLIKKEDKIFYD